MTLRGRFESPRVLSTHPPRSAGCPSQVLARTRRTKARGKGGIYETKRESVPPDTHATPKAPYGAFGAILNSQLHGDCQRNIAAPWAAVAISPPQATTARGLQALHGQRPFVSSYTAMAFQEQVAMAPRGTADVITCCDFDAPHLIHTLLQ